jgi:hypothetical protein
MASSWPTPDAAVSNDGEYPDSFLARQDRQKARGINGNGMGTPLAMAAKLWPTVAASEARQGFQRRPEGMASEQNQQSLTTIAMLWPTPIAANHRSIYASDETHAKTEHARPLNEFVGRWRTPTISEEKHGDSPNWIPDAKAGDHSLNRQASPWMTPRTVVGSYTRDSGDPTKERLTLEGQAALASFLPDPPISTVGEESSRIRRTLNPLFVEWLMGWPPGWTSLALTPPASNACACSATELSRFRQRMRSALFALGLPQAAPPAQLNLFG